MQRSFLLIAACVLLASGCRRAVSPDVAATVNDRSITYADLDKQFKMQNPNAGERPSDDLLVINKLEVLRAMIDGEIMLQRAEKTGLMASDSEVDARFNELKAPYTQDDFQKQLAARSMTAAELRTQLRRELSIEKLFNKEVKSRIGITDRDISDFFSSNRAAFNRPEPFIHMAQIVVTPQPDRDVRNLKGDKAQNDEQARKKVEMLVMRLRQGEDFASLAQNYSEHSESAQNGGDLGFVPESDLTKASPELSRMIFSLQPGQTSPPVRTPSGYQIFRVISKEPAGQRDLTDPRVQQEIRELLSTRKDQLYRAAFVETARNDAKVTNHYAGSIAKTK